MAIQEKSLLGSVPGKEPNRSPFANLGNFKPYTLYPQHFAIFHNNHIYRAHIQFRATDRFNLNNWEQLTINEVKWEDIIGDIKNNQELMQFISAIPADQIAYESGIQETDEITDPIPLQSENVSSALDELTVRNQETINTTDQKIKNEADARDQQIKDAITDEANFRQNQIDELNDEIQKTNNVLAGVHTTSLNGATLTRTLGGFTEIQKSLFSSEVVFMAGKTLLFDKYGTVGVYIGDVDQATINIMTKAISPVSELEPTLLGSVQHFGNLPLTVADAESLWGRTPRLDDFAHVMTDDNFDGLRVEYYITSIDGLGNIIWGNPVPLNTADFQAQTGAEDAGKVLVGGDDPGTFGNSIPIDLEPAENSTNLIQSGGVFKWFGNNISNLLTTAKDGVVNAINELKNSIDSITELKMFLAAHPVNSLYETVANDEATAQMMNDKYPGSTWEAWGAGRVTVSLNLNDPLFNTIGLEGGAKEVTLTAAQSGLPTHGHTQAAHSHGVYGDNDSGFGSATLRYIMSGRILRETTDSAAPAINNNSAQNASQAHTNLQPYKVCFKYKRLS